MDIKVIVAIISSGLYAHNKTIDTFEQLNLAIERFSENRSDVATLLDDQDADVSVQHSRTPLNYNHCFLI